MDYGSSDTSTTSLGTNQFPITEVYVPNTGLKALGGGPKQTDGSNPPKDYAPALVYIQDGQDVAQGTTTDTANTNTVVGQLKQIQANTNGSATAANQTTANTATGTKTDAKATDGSVTAWSVIALLKGIIDKLLSTLAVTQSGTWTVQPGNTANTTAWKVDGSAVTQPVSGSVSVSNFPGTQPVSASSLPLPTGAATAAKQPAIGTAGTPSADVTSVQGVVGGTAQPVSAASLPLPTGAAQEAGHLATIDTNTAASKTDLDAIVTNTNKIPASPATEGGNLAILAGIVSSSKAATKAASGDFADGAIVGIGTTTQTKATDGTVTSWSVIQLLKGIFDKLLGSIAVTGTFWQATQPVSGTITANAGTGNMGSNLAQVAGSNVAVGNNAVPVLNSAATGYVTAYGSNAAALTSATDYSFKWGAGGTTQVNHILLQNNTASSLNWDLDATATGGSPTLAAGQTLFLDVQTSILHLFQAGTPNVNGTAASNVVVRGWL